MAPCESYAMWKYGNNIYFSGKENGVRAWY